MYVTLFVLIVLIFGVNSDKFSKYKSSKSNKYFSGINLEAKAVYVYDDMEGRVLFEKDAHAPLALASITKLATIYCTVDHIGPNTLVQVPDSVYSYYDNATSTGKTELWSVNDLAKYTIITSSNFGAATLARYNGGEEETISCMNDAAQKLNMFDTTFGSVTGLDIDSMTPGSLGSAQDVVILLKSVYEKYADIMDITTYTNFSVRSKNGIVHNAPNTNLVADKLTGFVASKTGLTDIAGGNLVYLMDAGLNHKVYVAILGSTEEGRFEDALKLNEAIIKSFAN